MNANRFLAICDDNEKMANRLAEILKERTTFPFRVCVYSDIEILMEDILIGRVAVALISDRYIEEKIETLRRNTPEKTMIIAFNSGRYSVSDYQTIWKYQSAEGIRKELLSIYSEHSGAVFDQGRGNHKTSLTAFYTPVRRSLQTSFAICLGQIYSETEKCLYLNLQYFSGLPSSGIGQRDVADLIFFLRSGASRLSLKLESMLSTIGGLDYIEPARNFMDLSGISKDEWLLLVKTLSESGVYDRILLDISGETMGFMDVLDECDIIYTLSDADDSSLRKLEQYKSSLMGSRYDEILTKTEIIQMPNIVIDCEFDELSKSQLGAFVRDMISSGASVPSGVLYDELR